MDEGGWCCMFAVYTINVEKRTSVAKRFTFQICNNRVDQTSSWFEPGVNLSLVTQKEGGVVSLACGCRKCQKDTVQEDPIRVVEVLS